MRVDQSYRNWRTTKWWILITTKPGDGVPQTEHDVAKSDEIYRLIVHSPVCARQLIDAVRELFSVVTKCWYFNEIWRVHTVSYRIILTWIVFVFDKFQSVYFDMVIEKPSFVHEASM